VVDTDGVVGIRQGWPKTGGSRSKTHRCATAARPRASGSTATNATCSPTWTPSWFPWSGDRRQRRRGRGRQADHADLDAQQVTLGELHIDRAYLSSSLIRDRDPDLQVFCKAFPVRNGPRFAKPAFALDFDQGLLTCPTSVTMPFVPGGRVQFPAQVCAACPLRTRCPTSTRGRSVQIHPDERLLVELGAAQQTPLGRTRLRERVKVEHTLAHVGRWQGRRARYRGQRKNLFDLRRVAVVHNLHVIARQPNQPSKPPKPDIRPAL
jgi:Transposase DDE domain